jgi:hypothetical protein
MKVCRLSDVFYLTCLLAQVSSSAHLVSLQSRLMTSSHITAQVCRRKYAAALPLVGSLFRNLWKSSVGQSWSCCLWHVLGGLYLHANIQVITENSVMLEHGWVWNLAVTIVSVLSKSRTFLGLSQVRVRFVSAGAEHRRIKLTSQLSLVLGSRKHRALPPHHPHTFIVYYLGIGRTDLTAQKNGCDEHVTLCSLEDIYQYFK